MIDPFASEVGAEDLGVDIDEPTLNIEEERGDFATRALEGTDRLSESRAGVKQGEGWERPALVTVNEAGVPGDRGEAEGDYSFQDLGDSLEEDNNSEGSWGVGGLFARLVKEDPISFFQGGGVVAKQEERGEEGHQNAWGDTVNRLPNRVGDAIGPGGRGG